MKIGSLNANLKTRILFKLFNFKMDFFLAETTLQMYFTVLENNVNYLKRTKIEIKLKIRIIYWVCCSKQ